MKMKTADSLPLGCLVMAAGNAARFGANKLTADFRGKPLIAHALDAIPQAEFSRVLIVTQYDEVAALARRSGCEVLMNDHPERGQSESIRLGIAALEDCRGVCCMVADQPLLRRESISRALALFRSQPDKLVALSHGGVRGNPCIFPARLFPELAALSGDVGGSAVIRRHAAELLLLEADRAELTDVDTLEALLELENNAR